MQGPNHWKKGGETQEWNESWFDALRKKRDWIMVERREIDGVKLSSVKYH